MKATAFDDDYRSIDLNLHRSRRWGWCQGRVSCTFLGVIHLGRTDHDRLDRLDRGSHIADDFDRGLGWLMEIVSVDRDLAHPFLPD